MQFNLPNSLTVARIVLVFLFLILAANAGPIDAETLTTRDLTVRVVAGIFAFIAGATDFFDGYLARRWNQVTDFGKLMDPLADKIFITATMLILVEFRLMPAWIAVVVISREFMVTGLRTLAVQKGVVIAADRWGKVKTALQMAMLFLAGISWINLYDLRSDVVFGVRLWYLWLVFLWVIAIVTVGSGLRYFIVYRSLILNKKKK